MRVALAEAHDMAKRLFSPPGYEGYGDAKRYLSSDQCKGWLATLPPGRRNDVLEDLAEEVRLDALQVKRDHLMHFVGSEPMFFAWHQYKDPEEEMMRQIRLLSAAKESLEAQGDSIAIRKLAAKRDQHAGFKDFLHSGLSRNAYSQLGKAQYFYNPITGEPLSPRQIVRIIAGYQKANLSVGPSP